MKTVYANSAHPKWVKWICGITFFLGLGLFILFLLLEGDFRYLLYLSGFSLMYSTLFFGQYLLRRYEVDEERGTITDYQNKKYPLHISQLSTATYKESKKGTFRSLFLHDTGIGFMDIRMSKENADKLVAQLFKLNSAIEVKHVNYL